MPKLPDFKTEEEQIAWFDSHDTAAYIDEMEPADEEFTVIRTEFPTRPVDLRLWAVFWPLAKPWPPAAAFLTSCSCNTG